MKTVDDVKQIISLPPNSNIEEYYDYTVKNETFNINDRKRCWGSHQFIDAYLGWRNGDFSTDLRNADSTLFGYGVRFCKKCKFIECVHSIRETIEYRKGVDEFVYTGYEIGICERCHGRVLSHCWTHSNPSSEAWKLIEEVTQELGQLLRAGEMGRSGYGSAYYLEFPVAVSRMMKQSKPLAVEYIRSVFKNGLGKVGY